MTFLLDIDDTLLTCDKIQCGCGAVHYSNPRPIKDTIAKVNRLYDDGNVIILFTGRGWNHYAETKAMVMLMGIKHHELIMGRPVGIFIDSTDCASNLDTYL